MLDKSIPYHHILMRCDAGEAARICPAPLPSGFSYHPYAPGDELEWAKIEAAVGEFDSVENALAYFHAHFAIHPQALPERCWFIKAPTGALCATASAWWYEMDGEETRRRWAALHWVATLPGMQGMGLGAAIVSRAMCCFPSHEPGHDVYLHTQTWSYQAIGIYLRYGFYALARETFSHHTSNEFSEAMRVLPGHMRKELYDQMLHTAR